MKLYLKKYWWIFVAVTVGLLLTFFWLVAQAGRKKKPRVVRPSGIDKPLPDSAPDMPDPVLPDAPEVNLSPLASYLEKARAIDDEIKARKDEERVKAANERYR